MTRFHGLIAAAFTPMHHDGRLDLERIDDVTELLLDRGVQGLYVCGSTGEGPSLTTHERAEVAAAYVRAAGGRVPVIVQVGHNAIPDARALAEHAREIGADAVSATPPSYFLPERTETLVEVLRQVQEPARGLPFFYYHIPSLTGVPLDVPDFLPRLGEVMPDLAGIKFTAPTLHEMTLLDRDRFTVLFGMDEMLLSGLVAGAHGAVGSTYNLLTPLARGITDAFALGRLDEARRDQARYSRIVRTLVQTRSLPAIKATMAICGVDVGPARWPLRALDDGEREDLHRRLEAVGALDELRRDAPAAAADPR